MYMLVEGIYMPIRWFRLLTFACIAASALTCWTPRTIAQTENATVRGSVTDPTGALVSGASVRLIDIDRGIKNQITSNDGGFYDFASVSPGRYRMEVEKAGFRTVNLTGLTVNVQDNLEENFKLDVGAASESMTVEANGASVNTTDATVSTVIDRQFAENLPMNGRSFQTLIELTPGVVVTASNGEDMGQFSVNGQRPSANYWTVDGVSANIGTSPYGTPGNGLGGSVGGFNVQGGTNSLVSVDAMQEFRIQTSTYAPEFGRTPGGQISIVTRAGTNQFHGTAFDYLRNDVLDANNWFNGFTNSPPLPKAKERQNDFGGTIGGPIFKDRTFFFFSYEGMQLRLPQTALTIVPDTGFTPGGTTNSRQSAIPALRPYLNAYPLPNPQSPEIFVACDPTTDPTCPPTGQEATGSAALNASYSNPSTLDVYSLRIDHRFNDKLNLFGRYNYSSSTLEQRGANALSEVDPVSITMQTATAGATLAISSFVLNDLRINYSRVAARSSATLDTFGGAVAPSLSGVFPSPYTPENGLFSLSIFSLGTSNSIDIGPSATNLQQQVNVVDSLTLQRGSHAVKFGLDYRRLFPTFNPRAYTQGVGFLDVPSAQAGSLYYSYTVAEQGATFLFQNLGLFVQDTWKVNRRLTLTYGLRWDVDFSPSTTSGPELLSVTGFNSPSTLALAPAGQPIFSTRYGNVAPRLGVAYGISQDPGWQTVLRGGFGVFYDLATQELGNQFASAYPFLAEGFLSGGSFPLPPATAAPPSFSPTELASGLFQGFDPHLNLPYTLQWNAAVEQQLGKDRAFTLSYVGAVGRRLIQTEQISQPNASFATADLTGNFGRSDYNALQVQFRQRLSDGLQMLASYTWGHSFDTGSASSLANLSNYFSPQLGAEANRGPSDFDIRNALSAGITYDIPSPKLSRFGSAVFHGWSTENIVQARSAPPVDVYYSGLSYASTVGAYSAAIRPDVVSGIPLYLRGSQYPGGRALNAAAFISPPIDPITGVPLRQGDLGRNALRALGATQWDFAVHRDFPIRESLKVQFRAEMFNCLNHPNFGPPNGDLGSQSFPNPLFGLSTQMLGQSLNSNNTGGGAFSTLYQLGGPRSVQFALKLTF
jgi:hypothetical protein